MFNFQTAKIFGRIFNFVLGKYNLTNNNTNFSFENFKIKIFFNFLLR